MAKQEGPKREISAAKPDEEIKVALEKARAEAKAALIRAKAEERARLKAEKALAEAREILAAPQAEIEQEHQARVETEKALTEAQEALAAARAEVEQEGQARVKAEQARVEAERALAEVRNTIGAKIENMELPLTTPGEEGAEQRVSFVVRVTVDRRGQPLRTEVEHAQSGKKEPIAGLDAQRLVAFMKACLGPSAIPELAIPPAPPPMRVEVPGLELPKPAASLTISEVRVFRIGAPGGMALMLNSDEAFVVQAHFQLQGTGAPSLTAQESSYEVHVYAHDVTSGTSRLLTHYQANLAKGVLDYSVSIEAPGLAPGLYRLVTLVILREPVKMIGHYEGPIIQVVGVEQPIPRLLTSHI